MAWQQNQPVWDPNQGAYVQPGNYGYDQNQHQQQWGAPQAYHGGYEAPPPPPEDANAAYAQQGGWNGHQEGGWNQENGEGQYHDPNGQQYHQNGHQEYSHEQYGAGNDANGSWQGEAPQPPEELGGAPPPPDIEDPFGVPPPPESLLSSLIFDEPDSATNTMRDPQTQAFKAGTFAKLIEHLTHPTVHDANFLYDFILTYRSFATPLEVLEALIRRYETAQEEVKRAVGLRVFNMLKHWIEKAWHDFDKDAALGERCMDFLERTVSSNDPLKGVAGGIKSNLTKKKNGDEATITKASTNPPPVLVGPRDQFSQLMDLNSEEIARQLTLIEWDIWIKIQPWECLGLAWTKKNKEKDAPNVLALINRFNVVSGWVATTICTQESVKKRTKALGKFLEIAGHLQAMGNVNAVMEVVSGLGRGAVFRMKQTWDGLTASQKKTYEEVKKLTDRSLSYATLRAAVKKLNPPCIPYLGMYLTDLTFIEEGNKDHLGPNNLINWNKRHLISETIRQIRQYQLQAYIFTPVQWLQTSLKDLSVLTEDELYELSEWLEVRAGKERGPKPELLARIQAQQEASERASVTTSSSAASSSGTVGRGSGTAMASQLRQSIVPDSIALESGHNWPFYEMDSPTNVDVDPMTNVIHSGTLVKVVERLTHHSVNPDSSVLFGFLTVYRSFATATEVLDLLIQRWAVPPPKDRGNADWAPIMQKPIQLRVFNFIKTWLDRHFSDFEANPDLKQKLKTFISGPLAQGNEGYAKVLTTTVTKQEQGQASQAYEQPPPPIQLPPHITNPTLFDLNSEEFARQITLVHHRVFAAIKSEELLEQNYRSLEKEVKAKNVVVFQNQFHHQLVTYSKNELLAGDSIGAGPQVATKLLDIASKLVALRNLFAARAIIEAFDNIQRTKPNIMVGLDGASKSIYLENKDALISKFTTRTTLQAPMVLPLQPFFTEISTAEMGVGQPLPDKRINLEKRMVVAEALVRLMTYQKSQYAFVELPAYLNFFNAHKVAVAMPLGTGSSPGSMFMPRASSAAGGGSPSSLSSGSVSDLGPNSSTFKFFMMDCVLNDEDIKHEVTDIATEAYKMNLALIQQEIQNILAGKPPQKLPLVAPAPKAPMPVNNPPMVNPMLGPNPMLGTPNPMLGGPTPSFVAATGGPHGVSTPSLLPPAMLPVANNPPAHHPPPANSNPALGGPQHAPAANSNPAVGGAQHPPPSNSNPALGGPQHPPTNSNPALGNPALGNQGGLPPPRTQPGYTPAGGPPPSGNPNPPPGTGMPPPNTMLLTPNPLLAPQPQSNPALGNPALGNPAVGPSTSPTPTNPPPSNPPPQSDMPNRPLPGGKMPPGMMKIPPGMMKVGPPSSVVGGPPTPGMSPSNSSQNLNARTPPAATPPPPEEATASPAPPSHDPGRPSPVPPSNTPPNAGPPKNNPPYGGPVKTNPAGGPVKTLPGTPPPSGQLPKGPPPSNSPGARPLTGNPPPPTGNPPPPTGNPPPPTSNPPPPTGNPALMNPAFNVPPPTSNPPPPLGNPPPTTGNPPPPSFNPPPPTSNPPLPTSNPPPPMGNPPPPLGNPPPPAFSPPPPTSQPPSAPMSRDPSSSSLGSSGASATMPPPETPASPPPSNQPSDMQHSSSSPHLRSGSGSSDGGAKALPQPAFPKSRSSFTSASKQASIRDLMASLGKMSPSGPATRPMSGSGSFGTPPGTPPATRSNSNAAMLGSQEVPHSPSPSSSGEIPVYHQPAAPSQPAPVDLNAAVRAAATAQLATDFPGAQLAPWSAVEPGTNETLNADLLRTDRIQYVCSILPNVVPADLNGLVRVGKLFRQQNPTLPLACIVLTFNIDAQANELAGRYKMKVYTLTPPQ